MPEIPRYQPDFSLPPYAYVPGHHPHPHRHPSGHKMATIPDLPATADLSEWQQNRVYLAGIDLFNHGYYWEAHEQWEALWHLTDRQSAEADFYCGLIKLAASGVKIREGKMRGAQRHAERARNLFDEIVQKYEVPQVGGLRLHELTGFCDRIIYQLTENKLPADLNSETVFDWYLPPG